jgi:3-oxoacyl-[acyl-carrier-protein] synthase II
MVVLAARPRAARTVLPEPSKPARLSKTGESRPFDAARDGFVLGEGGGAVVLERADALRARGGVALAELLGTANNADAYTPVSPDPAGTGAAACMRLALADAGIPPERIGYVNAHGTATVMGDAAEAAAIRRVFGDHAVPVSSTKGATGHMMGAGGLTELIACVEAVRTGVCPPHTGCTAQDPAGGLNPVTKPRRAPSAPP